MARMLAMALGGICLAACGTTAHPPVVKEFSTPFQSRLKVSGGSTDIPADLPSVTGKAAAAIKAGKTDEALYYFVKALEIDPANITALIGIGHIHQDKGNFELAEAAYRMALKTAPKNPDALEGLGLVKLTLSDYRNAGKALTAAVAADPRRWQSHNALGLIADQAGQSANALRHYEMALNIKPKDPQILNNLGYSKYLAGDWHGALQAFDTALAINPGLESAWMNRGLVLARQGNDKGALESFRKVMNEADAYNDLGYIHMQQGDIDRSHELFEKAIFLSPTYHEKANENLRRLRDGSFTGMGRPE
jgi:Flp pilus assembly protein TadD